MKPVESAIMLCVTNALKAITPYVYFGKSQTVYPKINCDLRKFGEDDEMCRYRLVLDHYTSDGKLVTAVNMHEAAREILDHGQAETEDGALITFRIAGDGFPVPTKDAERTKSSREKIVQYEDAFEVVFWKNQSY